MKINILYIRQKNGIFLKGFVNNLNKDLYNIFILDLMHGEYISINQSRSYKITNFDSIFRIKGVKYLVRYLVAFIFLIKYRNTTWDICHILNIKRENFWLIPFLKKRSNKLLLTVYGRSTYTNNVKRVLFKRKYRYFDKIAFENRYTLEEFKTYNSEIEKGKLIICYPPIDHFSKYDFGIDKSKKKIAAEKMNLNPNLLSISCSSTILSNDQHFKVINELAKIENKNKVQLMFLLTYGGTNKERENIIQYINKKLIGFNVVIFDKFLSNEEVILYRYATDIYINMRKTDQLAGAVLESLACGTLLISGKWLNYTNFDNIGIKYNTVNTFQELSNNIDDSILSYKQFEQEYSKLNSKKIIEEYSKEVVMEKWEEIYKEQ